MKGLEVVRGEKGVCGHGGTLTNRREGGSDGDTMTSAFCSSVSLIGLEHKRGRLNRRELNQPRLVRDSESTVHGSRSTPKG